MGETINAEQKDILRHALGLGRGSREYRNHFVTGKGSTDYPHCEALVAAGLMARFPLWSDPMTNDHKCDVCGIEVTSGLMAAMCPYRERCEFWPEDEESQRFLDSLGMRYKPEPSPALPTME